MKILLLHDYGTATGGAELQMLSLRQGLRDRGHQVCLLTSRAQTVSSPLLSDSLCFGTTSKLQVLSQVANPSAYWVLRQVLRNFQPDVVHVRMFMWQLSPLILPLLRDLPCLYQTAVYKAICPLGTKVLPNGDSCEFAAGLACLQSGCLTPQSWAMLMLQRQLWLRWRSAFDRVVALSHGMKVKLEAEGISPVEVVHNGVPERPMRPALQNPPTVVFAGRLVPEKGVEVLLRAFAQVLPQVPQARLLIAGQGSEVSFLQTLAVELGISNAVTWLGHLPFAEMEQQFEAAWVQAVPSQWEEPFGNVSTEAMMRGTAVIASAVGGQPEIVQDGTTGFLVPPGEVEAIALPLLRLLSDRTLAEQMGQAGRQRALTHFSETQRTERFIDIYQQIQAKYPTRISHSSEALA
ncbi:MAG: glycosyltransferase family 4 protein [Drouetiella hepatica Uher 2000/2452]|jgi:glycosyltransferase involved in cell wall biosynthesis|uniref:Glycosyltransferase family 4 protein n=1 Tax=Drouetiella hepatica Uher 2000/2452 TaxID=904376 RepID=A0A951QE03_9CYAN|nr:glycosyltransferase family 4 protein [Drouetiella hepatica Uher 2000/2452]